MKKDTYSRGRDGVKPHPSLYQKKKEHKQLALVPGRMYSAECGLETGLGLKRKAKQMPGF
jgi:hypothetical protein